MLLYIFMAIGALAIYSVIKNAAGTNYEFIVVSDALNERNEHTVYVSIAKTFTTADALVLYGELLKKHPKGYRISCYDNDKRQMLVSNRPIPKTQYAMASIAFLCMLLVGCAPETKTVYIERNMPTPMHDTIICQFNGSDCVIDSSFFDIYNSIGDKDNGMYIVVDTTEPMSAHFTNPCMLYDTATAIAIRRAYWRKHINRIN